MPVLHARPAANDAFERLMQMRSAHAPLSDIPLLRRAFEDAQAMYADGEHWTGEPMIDHCLGMLENYLAFEPDDEGIVACLLHHVLDAKQWTLDDLEEKYGPNVRSIVSGVHLLSHVTMKNRRMSLENLRLMFLRVSDDIRVVLLILCDHNHKLARMDALPAEAQRHLSRDVLNLFAPVAARLGIYSLKHRMEARAFPVAYETDAARITEQLQEVHARHGDFLEQAALMLRNVLADAGIEADVEAREKSPYSIFQKMHNKSVTHVEDIYDLFALRVIVRTDAECYQALGILHRVGHPVAGRFKDYIGFPKPNGYQSLHTTIARLPGVPEGVFIEVQVRTRTMHRDADLGIAAHWTYKQAGAGRAMLQRVLSSQQAEGVPGPYDDERIFALTPKGDIIELPEGATPLDFAFNVHTMLGLSFRSARVNGSIVPLSYPLENGDIVEIMRHKEPHPSPNWLSILRTPAARSRLKRFLVEHDRPTYLLRGKEALNAELTRRRIQPLDQDLSVLRMVDGKQIAIAEREELLIKIGQGAQNASSLLPHLTLLADKLRAPEEERKTVVTDKAATARVDGDIPMPVRFARCCKAEEKERGAINGVIGRDGVVRVHRDDCKMLRNANPERLIGVHWEEAGKKKRKR